MVALASNWDAFGLQHAHRRKLLMQHRKPLFSNPNNAVTINRWPMTWHQDHSVKDDEDN
jgi:hypothetical protein